MCHSISHFKDNIIVKMLEDILYLPSPYRASLKWMGTEINICPFKDDNVSD